MTRLLVVLGMMILSADTADAFPPRGPRADRAVPPTVQTADSTVTQKTAPAIFDRANLLPGYVETGLRELLGAYLAGSDRSLVVATVDSLGSGEADAYASRNHPGETVLLLVDETQSVLFAGEPLSDDGAASITARAESAFRAGRPDAAAVQAVQGLLAGEAVQGQISRASDGSGSAGSSGDSENSPVLLWIFMLIFCSIPVLAAPKLFFTRRYTRWSRMLILSLSFALGGCVGGDGSLSLGFRFWIAYLVGFNLIRFGLVHTRWGDILKRSIEEGSLQWLGALSTTTVVLGSMAAGSASSGSSGGGFSGGGGSFGGGGASGSW